MNKRLRRELMSKLRKKKLLEKLILKNLKDENNRSKKSKTRLNSKTIRIRKFTKRNLRRRRKSLKS